MGFVKDIAESALGIGGQGGKFQAQSADLITPTTANQATSSYNRAENSLDNMNSFVNAIQGQGRTGLATQSDLTNRLNDESLGYGPDPAKAMLAESTAANVANQASLAAGQRGAASNVGLIARQTAQQGANTQQQAIGQGAVMKAQQQLAAQDKLQQLAANQVSQTEGANVANTQAAQGQENAVNNALAQQNSAKVSNVSSQNSTNQAMAAQNAKTQGGLLGGAIGGIASAFGGPLAGALGFGGNQDLVGDQTVVQATPGGSGPLAPGLGAYGSGSVGPAFAKGGQIPNVSVNGSPIIGPKSMAGQFLAKGGTVKAMVSPGEKYIPPASVAKVASGKIDPMKAGKTVPGKPKVKGDSLKNDTVPAKLEPGGVVIPNHIMQSKDASKKAKAFVDAILAKQASKRAA